MIRFFCGKSPTYDSTRPSQHSGEAESSSADPSTLRDSIALTDYSSQHTEPLFKAFKKGPDEIKKFIPTMKGVYDCSTLHAALTGESSGMNLATSTILYQNKPVGAISSSFPHDDRSRGIYIESTWIGKKYRNKGIMTKAKRLYIEGAMQEHIPFVQAVVAHDNRANQRVLEKLNILGEDSGDNSFIYRVTPQTWKPPSVD